MNNGYKQYRNFLSQNKIWNLHYKSFIRLLTSKDKKIISAI